ncbi:MAG: transposase [Gammaproteobacteria bacterium]
MILIPRFSSLAPATPWRRFGAMCADCFSLSSANMLRMSEVNATGHQTMAAYADRGDGGLARLGRCAGGRERCLAGGEQSVLLLDESAFAKKGESSAGVARQWNGRLGKVDNCQMGGRRCAGASRPA